MKKLKSFAAIVTIVISSFSFTTTKRITEIFCACNYAGGGCHLIENMRADIIGEIYYYWHNYINETQTPYANASSEKDCNEDITLQTKNQPIN